MNYQTIIQQVRQQLGTPMPLVGRRWGKIDPRDKLPLASYQNNPLSTLQEEQDNLLKHGKVVWSALIQANGQLFQPKRTTLPGEIIVSLDTRFDSQPEALQEYARNIYTLKGTVPSDPELRIVAERITNEFHRSLGERIPQQLTGGHELYRYTVLFHTPHLPDLLLNGYLFPTIVIPKARHAMIVPSHYWPEELLQSWKPTIEQRGEFARLMAERQKQPLVQATPEAQDILHKLIAQHQVPGETLRCRVTISEAGNEVCLDPNLQHGDVQYQLGDLIFVLDAASAQQANGTVINYSTSLRGFSVGYA